MCRYFFSIIVKRLINLIIERLLSPQFGFPLSCLVLRWMHTVGCTALRVVLKRHSNQKHKHLSTKGKQKNLLFLFSFGGSASGIETADWGQSGHFSKYPSKELGEGEQQKSARQKQ